MYQLKLDFRSFYHGAISERGPHAQTKMIFFDVFKKDFASMKTI